MCEYGRKSMVICEKILTSKSWQRIWNFVLDDFLETRAKRSPTSPGLMIPTVPC